MRFIPQHSRFTSDSGNLIMRFTIHYCGGNLSCLHIETATVYYVSYPVTITTSHDTKSHITSNLVRHIALHCDYYHVWLLPCHLTLMLYWHTVMQPTLHYTTPLQCNYNYAEEANIIIYHHNTINSTYRTKMVKFITRQQYGYTTPRQDSHTTSPIHPISTSPVHHHHYNTATSNHQHNRIHPTFTHTLGRPTNTWGK